MSSQKIFFSYSRVDSPFALTLAKDLREAGADIWIDQLDIPAGTHWDAAVEKALNSAAYVLVILTPASTASTNVMDEVSFALESGKKIIPVLLEDCLPPFRLRRLQRIDFTSDYTSGFNQLIISLNLTLGNTIKLDHPLDDSGPSTPVTPTALVADPHEKEKRDNRQWEEACKLNTIASYKKYLLESPNGSFTEEAKLMIKQLEVEQKEDELEAMLWQKTKSEHSKNLYLNYLQQYPQGNYRSLALAAIAEFEKVEKEEERQLKELATQKEKEQAQKVKEEKEKQDLLEKERIQKAKEEQEKQLLIEKEKAQKAKEEREKALALEKEIAQKAREEREKQLQEERVKAQREKEEREKQKQQERDQAQREKDEREKLKQQEKEKAALLKQQEKEKLHQERLARGEGEPSGSGSKKYILIGGGILLLILAIWGLSGKGSKGDDSKAWMTALTKNDSTAFASYMQEFPEGKHFTQAKERIDSIYWAQQAVKDSMSQRGTVSAEVSPDPSIAPANTANTETDPTAIDKPANTSSSPNPPNTTKPANTTKPTNTTKTKPATTPTKPKENPSTPPGKIVLGQDYGGGIVIYVTPKGDHGMIVSAKEVGSVDWDKAKKICMAYKVGTIEGWRLPSKDELNIIYQNRKYLGEYTKGGYWSSTEEGKNSAIMQNFSNGNATKANKQSAQAVRAVRPF